MSEHTSEEEESAAPESTGVILDGEGQLAEAIDELASQLPDDYPTINNDCWVTVQLKLNNFTGEPEQAVEMAMLDFMTFGLHDRVVMVHDPDLEQDYAVLQGRTLSEEEIADLQHPTESS